MTERHADNAPLHALIAELEADLEAAREAGSESLSTVLTLGAQNTSLASSLASAEGRIKFGEEGDKQLRARIDEEMTEIRRLREELNHERRENAVLKESLANETKRSESIRTRRIELEIENARLKGYIARVDIDRPAPTEPQVTIPLSAINLDNYGHPRVKSPTDDAPWERW